MKSSAKQVIIYGPDPSDPRRTGGVPVKTLKWRWTVEEILEHERVLYPLEQRLAKERLCVETPR